MRPGRLAVLAAGGGVALLGGCAQSTPGAVSAAPPPAAPLATAVVAPGGTWATVAVGRLDDPTNTFWQLLYRPSGSNRWVDDVAATATATNGGLDLAATGSGVLAGVRPSQNLTFSPVIETGTGGSSWVDGLLPAGLSATPQALAASAHSARSALLGSPGAGQRLVTAASGVTRWNQVATARDFASAETSCGLTDLDAIVYAGPTLLAGGACSLAGAAGLFEVGPDGTPSPIGPPVRHDTTAQILALSDGTDGVSALLALRRQDQLSLSVASSDSALRVWSVSPPLALNPSTTIASVTGNSGGFLVLADQAGRPALYSAGPGSAGWEPLPAPPTATATVAPVAHGALSALTTSGTTIVSWDREPGASAWVQTQTLDVPVLFGSSS